MVYYTHQVDFLNKVQSSKFKTGLNTFSNLFGFTPRTLGANNDNNVVGRRCQQGVYERKQ